VAAYSGAGGVAAVLNVIGILGVVVAELALAVVGPDGRGCSAIFLR
jgi:hypothetical protein